MSSAIAPTTAAPAKSRQTLRQLLDGPEFASALSKSLPTHLKPDRFLRVAQTAMTKTPKLLQCDQKSFLGALLTLSQLGIEPDGRRAHLIPFKNNKASNAAGHDVYDCQLIIDYKGVAELVYRSGLVSVLHADVVRSGDVFEYTMGELKKHIPWYLRTDAGKPGSEGEVIAAYATARMKDGGAKTEVMSLSELEGIRKRSKSGNDGPWVTDRTEMQKKTVFKRLSKWLPLSAEIRDAVSADDTDVIDLPASTSQAITAGGLADALSDDSTESGGKESPAVDREKLIAEMQEAVLSSNGKLTEKKLLEYAKRAQLATAEADDFWTLPTASLVAVNGALPELAK